MKARSFSGEVSMARLTAVDGGGTAAPKRRKRRILGLDEEQRQAQRRALLLDAALELFGTRGYAKTPIELLCHTAGVGTNSFYELFPNKEAVLIGLYDGIAADLRAAVAEAFAAHHDDPGLIRATVAAFVHGTLDDPRVARVAFVESAGVSAQVEEHRRRARNDFVEGLLAIGQVIRAAAPRPAAPKESAEPAQPVPSPRRNAIAIVGAIIETTLDWLLDPDPDPIDRLIDDIAHHCRRVMDAVVRESAPISR
jgi:AcrR family transcriptional regulator